MITLRGQAFTYYICILYHQRGNVDASFKIVKISWCYLF